MAGVFRDVDGTVQVAVVLDDDPARDELLWQGRYLFFHPDEIELRGGVGGGAPDDRERSADRSYRQRPPARRRLRGGGGPAAHGLDRCPTVCGWPTSGYAACTWPTSSSTATTPWSWWTPSPSGRPRARWRAIEPQPIPATDAVVDAHTMGPDVVLATLARLGAEVNRIRVVGCQPATLEEGVRLHRWPRRWRAPSISASSSLPTLSNRPGKGKGT